MSIAGPAQVNDYRFGTATVELPSCRICGVVPVATGKIDGTLWTLVGVRAFEVADRAELDGEGTDDRLDRHRDVRIGDMTIERGATLPLSPCRRAAISG